MITEQQICDKYLKKYIPYTHKGRDPKTGLDCYGLIKCIYQDAGIELMDVEDYAIDWSRSGEDYFMQNYYRQFDEVPIPHFLDIVLLNRGEVACHAGVVLEGNRFIHCSKAGINIQPLRRWFQRIVGFYRVKI